MSPNEMAALMLIDGLGQANRRTISKKLAISTNYASYLCEGLLRRDYLTVQSDGKSRNYSLAEKGVEAVLGQLVQLRGALESRTESCRRRKERVDERIGKLVESNRERNNPR